METNFVHGRSSSCTPISLGDGYFQCEEKQKDLPYEKVTRSNSKIRIFLDPERRIYIQIAGADGAQAPTNLA